MRAKHKVSHGTVPPPERMRENRLDPTRAIGTPEECRTYVQRHAERRRLADLEAARVAMRQAQDAVRAIPRDDNARKAERERIAAAARRARANYVRLGGEDILGERRTVDVSTGAESWTERK
jgi:hypothetical protein